MMTSAAGGWLSRRRVVRREERGPQGLLTLCVRLADKLRAAEERDPRAAVMGDGAGKHRLAGPVRAVEQHAARCPDADCRKVTRPPQRELDLPAEQPDHRLQAADLVVRGHAVARAAPGTDEAGESRARRCHVCRVPVGQNRDHRVLGGAASPGGW